MEVDVYDVNPFSGEMWRVPMGVSYRYLGSRGVGAFDRSTGEEMDLVSYAGVRDVDSEPFCKFYRGSLPVLYSMSRSGLLLLLYAVS